MTEEWRWIPEFEGLYQVSSLGRVRSVDRKVPCKRRGTLAVRGRVLRARGSISNPYPGVWLCAGRNRRRFATVHTLAMEAFVGPRPDGQEVRHLDGNPRNNRLDNLAYGTSAENKADAERHGSLAHGERSGQSKLTAEQVEQIRARLADGESQESVASDYGVTQSHVSRIHRRVNWRRA